MATLTDLPLVGHARGVDNVLVILPLKLGNDKLAESTILVSLRVRQWRLWSYDDVLLVSRVW